MSLRVAFVSPASADEDAAWEWLAGIGDVEAKRFPPESLGQAVEAADVVWVHAASPLVLPGAAALAQAASEGCGIVLTLAAAELVVPMGIESAPPNDIAEGRWSHDGDEYWTEEMRAVPRYPHVRGLATWGPHPLVDGLHNGTYCWAPSEGERWIRRCYSHGARPAEGRVVGVDRAYIAHNADRVVAWEYRVGRGRVVCIGAYVCFAAPDRLLRQQLERLAWNAIRASRSGDEEPRATWPLPAAHAVPSGSLTLPEPLELDGALPEPAGDPAVLVAEPSGDEQFDLAGRRMLLVGREHAGIREMWAHPHRAVASWDVTADGEGAGGVRLTVTPDVTVRALETSSRRVVETCFVALEHPIAVVEYRAARKGRSSVGRSPAALEVRFTVDLQRMWPFPAGCGGNLRFRRSAHGLVAVVASESDTGLLAVFLGRPAEMVLREVHGATAPLVECVVSGPLGMPLRLAVVGASDPADLDRTLRAFRRLGVAGLVRQRLQRAQTIRDARVSLRTDDPRVPRALEWAKRRLDLFLGDVPGVGRSLLAGYAPSRPGWANARPGYAWFFGRDSCWCAFALLAVGEHSLPRQVIRFLGDRQDVSGKVLHEATTSGQFHYDAADSTPLYLLLVARYLRWSADTEFVRSVWPRVLRALDYCLSTDADGDGLIENTRAGHGWIEGGPLGGAHVTLYLAALWRMALEGVAYAAETLGESRIAAECRARAARAAERIESAFYDDGGRYALDLRVGGGRTMVQSALHSVPLLLGAIAPQRAQRWLDEVAADSLSAPWGVRMLPLGDPRFNPAGYHGGSVWPLFTGWVSLAEYRAGRAAAAFRHLGANAQLAFQHQLGAFDEVLHGLSGVAAGVCPDQAWSAAMVAQPVVEGLMGVEPDAPGGRLTVAPALPEQWGWLELRGLRCGESVYDVRVRRREQQLLVRLRRTLGPGLWLTVSPLLASPGARVTVDESEVEAVPTRAGEGVRCAVSFFAAGEHEVLYDGGT